MAPKGLKLSAKFAGWFGARGWHLHPHQQEILSQCDNPCNLLIAPTGGGKTLAGFLPSLVELEEGTTDGLHTIYVSPLKALANDIKRNLMRPIEDLELPIRVEERTGDTTQTLKKRQRVDPPHILLTTPESLALLISYKDNERMFKGVKRIIIDEAHALAESKRGDQLMLSLAVLQQRYPDMKRIGLSATVEAPERLGQFLAPVNAKCNILEADPGPDPDLHVLRTETPPPWAGAGAIYAVPYVMNYIKEAKTTLVFINTRAQAEIFFHALWQANDEDLPIGLHHGSLSKEARDKVETAMSQGALRAIVCTGSLDLGIDWGDVDLVIQIGAPKNIKRLVQRIGRSNHQYNAPSRALIVPANRFEVIECQAALEAVRAGQLDGDPRGAGPLDVLCQHVLIAACSGAFDADDLFEAFSNAGPYHSLTREEFDACLEFCATGGYAFRAYDRWKRLMQRADGQWQLRDPRQASRIRMNIGTIIDTETLKVRLKNRRGGKPLGEVEEAFAATLVAGDTFLIGGQTVRYEGLREMSVEVTKSSSRRPKIAVFSGTKFATSTVLSHRVISLLNASDLQHLPAHTQDWLATQRRISQMPTLGKLLIETFKRRDMHYSCIYGFAGRNAHQTLGLLLTRQMEANGLEPIGFVSNDYALLIWGLQPISAFEPLLQLHDLKSGLQDWLGENAVMKRSFRNVATISGLIERNQPGARKTGRQATFSSDILYDTLRKYDPDHILMRITEREAKTGLIDFGRIEEALKRTGCNITHVNAPHVTPLAAPLLLEVGKVPIKGAGNERLLEIEAGKLMEEAQLKHLA